MKVTANPSSALEPVGATVVLSPQSNKPLQRTGPAPALGSLGLGEPAPQLNVMYVGLTCPAGVQLEAEVLRRCFRGWVELFYGHRKHAWSHVAGEPQGAPHGLVAQYPTPLLFAGRSSAFERRDSSAEA